MLVAILHVIPQTDDPHAIVARLLDAVPPGSQTVEAGNDAIVGGRDATSTTADPHAARAG